MKSLRLPEGPLVVALSGGADSAALAWLIVDQGRPVRAVHVDHGLPGSPTMRAAAIEIGERLGIEVRVVETTVAPGASPEGQARSARYLALAGAVEPHEQILTAHTADDNIETVIINLVRGTGTRGLAGIPSFRPPNIHRPLLGADRSVLRELAVLAGLPFVDDPMNTDPAITRNRVRTRVLPLLREFNPALGETITRTTRVVGNDADLLDSLVGGVVTSTADGMRVAVGDLLSLSRPLAERVVIGILVDLGLTPTADRVDRVWSVVVAETDRQQIADDVEAGRQGPFLTLERKREAGSTLDLTAGEHHHGGLVYEVVAIDEVCLVAPLSRWHAIFPSDTTLTAGPDGVVSANGEPAWTPGEKRLPVAWYRPGDVGYLSVLAREESGWTSSP